MAYYTDTVNDFVELKSDIESYLISNGWTIADDILSKDSCFYKLVASTTFQLSLFGGLSKTGATLNDQPSTPTKGGNYVKLANFSLDPITFPITYHLFIFNDPIEVYCFIEYNSGYYQHIAFGKSNLQGIGLGSWFTGSFNGSSYQGSELTLEMEVAINQIRCKSSFQNQNGDAFVGFFCNHAYTWGWYPTSFIYSTLDSSTWKHHGNLITRTSSTVVAGLLTSLPNLSNQATVLLPIKVVQDRSSGGLTILANFFNSRLLRIDNHEPKDLVTFGSEQWMIFPWYRRDVVNRNSGDGVTHTGTFGLAIRYGV